MRNRVPVLLLLLLLRYAGKTPLYSSSTIGMLLLRDSLPPYNQLFFCKKRSHTWLIYFFSFQYVIELLWYEYLIKAEFCLIIFPLYLLTWYKTRTLNRIRPRKFNSHYAMRVIAGILYSSSFGNVFILQILCCCTMLITETINYFF